MGEHRNDFQGIDYNQVDNLRKRILQEANCTGNNDQFRNDCADAYRILNKLVKYL